MKKFLEQTGFPVAYHHFEHTPLPPFLAYYVPFEATEGSDFKSDIKTTSYTVELYTEKKDPKAESKVEELLRPYHWDKTQVWIESQKLWQTIYEFKVMEVL